MNWFNTPRFWLVCGVTAGALLLLQQFWKWEIERVEVGPGQMLIRVHRWGQELTPEQIVAPDDSHKGVMQEVNQAGRYFLNPIFWSHEIKPMVDVPPGKALVLIRKSGRPIPSDRLARGDILAGDGERGIVPGALKPGSYPINPYAYDTELVDAVEVTAAQVGVRTLKVGKDPSTLKTDPDQPRYVVPDGYRGVQQTTKENGIYYINPYVETITPVEVRSHKTVLEDIEFPSRDGFTLKPHVTVEYQVRPEKAPEVLVRLTDAGVLHQRDATPEDQRQNEILQKVILPHIRGYARIEGSNFRARDFIMTEDAAAAPGQPPPAVRNMREQLQDVLLKEVKARCEALGIEVRAVRLGRMEPPPDLADQFRQRYVARVTQEQNKALLGQYKEQQKLKGIEALKQQNQALVEANTSLTVAETKSKQLLEVEQLKLEQELASAKIRLEAAKARAEAVLTKAKAEAAVIDSNNQAEVAAMKRAVQGFGDVQRFAQYHVVMHLAPALREIFAADTSDFAKIFAGYLNPPATSAKPKLPLAEKSRTQNTAKAK